MFLNCGTHSELKKIGLLLGLACCLGLSAKADGFDTIQPYMLQGVEIKAERQPELLHKLLPSQSLNELSLERLNPVQVSDAVKHFSGANVKDYGGIGGLKTVSVRSLGSTHTGIVYDGIPVGDCQSGQIDLGRFSMENVNCLSLSNGQISDMLQTARALASASVLSISNIIPQFEPSEWVKAQAYFKMGSFGLLNPGINIQNKITSKLSSGIHFSWQKSDGNYPFTIQNGDSSKTETRSNTDIETYQGEANLYFFPKENQSLFAKASFYSSERGLPGAVILYNTKSSEQRLWDKIYFGQAQYKAAFKYNTQLLLSGKYTYSYTRYLDPKTLNLQGKTDDEYTQNEYYISGAFSQKLFNNNFEYLINSDLFFNTLASNLTHFAYPERLTSLSGLTAKYSINLLQPLTTATTEQPLLFVIQGNLLSTWTGEKVETGNASDNKYKLSPNVGLSLYPFKNTPFQIRFFYKESYRLPTFNELYYNQMGNKNLKPETAKQLNLGVSYYQTWENGKHYVSGSLDAYQNTITDKIVAIPIQNLFLWSMQNIGKVDIKGIDISFKGAITPLRDLQIYTEANYTWQNALDVTTPESKLYENHIPYTPVNSGSCLWGISFKSFDLSYSFTASGERYSLGQNTPKNLLPGYVDQNISASYKFDISKTAWRVAFDVLNLTNVQYEVVKNYPMPGRWYRASLWLKF